VLRARVRERFLRRRNGGEALGEAFVAVTVVFGSGSVVEVERVAERIVAEGAVPLGVVAAVVVEAANEDFPFPHRLPPPVPPPLLVRRCQQILPPRRR